MSNEDVSDHFLEVSRNLARHNLEVSFRRAKEECFRAAKQIARESAEGARKMDDFVRSQYADEPRKMTEWEEIMEKYKSPDEIDDDRE